MSNGLLKICLYCLLLLIMPLPGRAGEAGTISAGDRYEEQKHLNPEFAASEKALRRARKRFLAVLGPDLQKPAERLLLREEFGELQGVRQDEPDQEALERLLKEREPLLRYLELTAQAGREDEGFLILLRPVCLEAVGAGRGNLRAAVIRALREYNAFRVTGTVPPGYILRRVTRQNRSEIWGVILHDDCGPSPDGGDAVAAHVLRVVPGTKQVTVMPLIAPSMAAFFPSSGGRPAPRGSLRGPDGKRVDAPEPVVALTLTNDSGPFHFTLALTQNWAAAARKGKVTAMAVPECTNFPYTWSETSLTYLRGLPECRTEEWGYFSPIEGGELLPVVDRLREERAANPECDNHLAALDAAWTQFRALFAPKTRAFVESIYTAWLAERMYAVYGSCGDSRAFSAALKRLDEPVIAYMREAASLLKNPDARLFFLLEPLHALRPELTALEKDGGREDPERRQRALLRGEEEPALTALAAEQVRVLQTPLQDETAPTAGRSTGIEHSLWQKGEKHIVAGASGGSQLNVASFFPLPPGNDGQWFKDAYRAVSGFDGEVWGLAACAVFDPQGGGIVPRHQITRIHKGLVDFVTPALPDSSVFFRGGKELWPSLDGEGGVCSPACRNQPAFSVDTFRVPFGLTAVAAQPEFPGRGRTVECTPECSAPYIWKDGAYVPDEPRCLPEGRWGCRAEKE